MRTLGLVLSTGRCATTSIEEHIRVHSGRNVHVYHERLSQRKTMPGRYFRAYDPDLLAELEALPAVRDLLQELAGFGDETVYVETGWTLYPVYPLLIERHRESVRLLHVTRHPVQAAASTALHGLYDDTTEVEFGIWESDFLRPWTKNAFFPSVAQDWREMTVFERNLYRVCAISKYLLELHARYPDVPYLRLKLEDFTAETGRQILDFFGVLASPADEALPRTNELKRLARGARSIGPEWRRASHYPWAVEVGRQLDYDMSPSAVAALEDRMKKYSRRGPIERLAHAVYSFGPLRRFWRRVIVPRLRRR